MEVKFQGTQVINTWHFLQLKVAGVYPKKKNKKAAVSDRGFGRAETFVACRAG